MNKLFFLLIFFLSANDFFQINSFGNIETACKTITYLLFAILLILSLKGSKKTLIYGKKNRIVDKCVIFLLLCLLISIINAFLFKNQDILIGLMTSLPIFIVYLLYFVLKRFQLQEKDLRKIILLLGTLYCIFNIISVLTLPNPLFGRFTFEEDRGGFRLRIPGLFWVNLMYFLLIGKYLVTKKLRYLLFAFLSFLIIASSLARQYIIWSVVLGGLYLFKSFTIRKKIHLIVIIVFLGLYIVPNIPLVKNLTELSDNQKQENDEGKENVRLVDYRVFLYEYERNPIQYLCGCGIASYGNSKYGKELEQMAKDEQLIHADAGWAGFVFYYGYLSALILFILYLYILKAPLQKEYVFYKYFLLYVMLCAIAGGPIIYYHEYIISIVVFYIIVSLNSYKTIANATYNKDCKIIKSYQTTKI